MGKALYRKYRSKTLGEVFGQDHITTVLKNSLKKGTFSHAYLFTGPRGVGKTSVARILAKDLNGLKDDGEQFYPDIIEIDAASNRRIDEIRELREKVVIAPSQLKYKVYIIDEVHMLTREAFNALLKTLEEPPEHAIFILATTDFQKVPETIISRCIRLSFKPISEKDIVSHLKNIAKKEKITIDDSALSIIAEYSDGSFRDAISTLDQLSSTESKIDTKLVEAMLGISSENMIEELLEYVKSGDLKQVISKLDNLLYSGATADKLIQQISAKLRNSLTGRTYFSASDTIWFLENLSKAYNYIDQKIGLEIALLKIANKFSSGAALNTTSAEPPDKLATPVKKNDDSKKRVLKSASNVWTSVLDILKNEKNSLYGIARMAESSIEGDELRLAFKFAFHYKQMSLEKNKNIIYQALKKIDTDIKAINIVLVNEDEHNDLDINSKSTKKRDVSSISNIFGSVEVLES